MSWEIKHDRIYPAELLAALLGVASAMILIPGRPFILHIGNTATIAAFNRLRGRLLPDLLAQARKYIYTTGSVVSYIASELNPADSWSRPAVCVPYIQDCI